MANPNFTAEYSTNQIYRDLDLTRCLTDDLDTMDSEIQGLSTSKAELNHTHTGYAAASHTHSGYAATDHTHSEYAGATHTHGQADITGLTDALAGKAAASHTHTEYAAASHTHDYAASNHTHTPASIGAAAASHTHSNNVIVEQTGSPYIRLKLADVACEARVYKNASTTADYGLTLADYDNDGAKDSLIFCRNNDLANKLYLNVQNDDDTRSLYYLYGEHHKPTADEVGALPLTGGTITGDTNVNGVLRVNGQQSFYFQTSTMSQTVGTNNATGGTTICCGASADVGVNGTNMKTSNILPKANNAYTLGNTNYRWKGIYSTAAVNVSSDRRMKRDIAPMNIEELANFVNFLEVKTFNYKDDAEDATARIGLIAQEVQGVNPDIAKFFVKEDENGMLGLTPADLVFAAIGALQVANKRIEALEYKVAELENHKCNCNK